MVGDGWGWDGDGMGTVTDDGYTSVQGSEKSLYVYMPYIRKSLNVLESCVLGWCAKYSHYLRR